MKVRVKFKKYGSLRFISHLDVMQYFRKAIRRAQIPVKFTEGLSPHMAMSFASPLSLGFTSEGEYFDMELKEPISGQKAAETLNQFMADGIETVSIRQIPEDRSMGGAALLSAADFLVTPSKLKLPGNFAAKAEEFLSLPCIFAVKKTKRSENVTDIKPLVCKMAARGEDVFLRLAAGSASSLNPELAMKAFCEFAGISFEDMGFRYCRLEMYANIKKDGKDDFVSLEGLGTEATLQ